MSYVVLCHCEFDNVFVKNRKKANDIKLWKAEIIKFFMKIKPMIKPEDFSGVHDESH